MFDAAKTIIRMSLQDIGPPTIPDPTGNTTFPVPGCVWPHEYIQAWARAIYERQVDVEIVLSNPKSIPGDLSMMDACYGNGWTTIDVASEIIKAIEKLADDQEKQLSDDEIRKIISENLRVTYIKQSKFGAGLWKDGQCQGNHAKFFIIDDRTYYMGSQNLYECDLAEWGVVIDDEGETQRVMEEYWNKLWAESYDKEKDNNVEDVMGQKDKDRTGEDAESKKAIKKALRKQDMEDPMHILAHHAGGKVPGVHSKYHKHDPDEPE